MSDPNGRSGLLTGRGERPTSQQGVVEPPESGVTAEVRFREAREQSGRTVHFDEAQLDQLALALSQRLAEPKARWTLGELAARWLGRVKRVRLQDEQRNVVQLKPLWHLKEGELTPALIGEWFGQLAEMGFSPISINKYRSAGRLVIRDAQANAQWGSSNPFDLVRRLREPRRKYELLSLEELRRTLPHLRADHRRMARLTVALGLRSGELFALRKADVDFAAGVIHVRRSHARETTKTGKARTVPLLACIAGDLECRHPHARRQSAGRA